MPLGLAAGVATNEDLGLPEGGSGVESPGGSDCECVADRRFNALGFRLSLNFSFLVLIHK